MKSARSGPLGSALQPLRWLLAVVFFLCAQGLQVGAQSCGLQWTWRHPLPSGGWITTDGTNYLVTGQGGTVALSTDGLTWTPVRPFTGGSLYVIGWGHGRYLGVTGSYPDQNILWSSPDGIFWSPVSSPHPTLGYMKYTGGFFFNMANGQIQSSTDGSMWTPLNLGGSVISVTNITYGAGLYVVLADQGAIFTSTDTQTWTARRDAGSSSLWYLAFGNGVFVAVGNQGQVITSVDGATWSEAAPPTIGSMNGLFFAAGRFFSATDDSTIITSWDGVHWDVQATPFTYIGSMASRPADTVAIGWIDDPVLGRIWGMAQTYDGIIWRRVDSSATRSDLNAAASGGSPSRLVAVGNGGAVIWSADGGPFEPGQSATSVDLRGAAWGAGRFVAVGASGQILTSEDGASWIPRNSTVASVLNCVRWLHGLFVCVGEGGTLLTSSDGISWSKQESGTTVNLLSSAWGAGSFVVTGADDTILSSPDAAHWTLRYQNAPAGNYILGVSYGNGTFCAVGCCGNESFVSVDGASWTRLDGYLGATDVIFWQGQFVVVTGHSTGYYISPNGREWVGLASGGPADLKALAIDRDRIVGVGAKGAILESDCGPAVTGRSPVHGSTLGGEVVTLTGVGLQDAQAVYFGAMPASSFAVVSATRIDAVTPPNGPGNVTISVRTAEGYSPDAFGTPFEYILPPYIQSVSPARVSTMGGTLVTITGANFFPSEILVDGYPVEGGALSNDTVQATVLPHPAGSVDVTIRNYDGQSATLKNALMYVDPPIVLGATVIRRPMFKLKLTGTNFHPGCVVMVNDQPAPTVKYKGSTALQVKGASVARLFKPHHWVLVRIVNTDDGISGPTFGILSN